MEAGTPVVTLTLLDPVKVQVQVSADDEREIRTGARATPEVVIPLEKAATGPSTDGKEIPGLHEGSQIRVIREPYFGRLARVTDLPAQLTVLPSGSRARVLEVELEGGERAILPRANVELIER